MVTKFGLQLPNFTFPGVPEDQLFERIAASAAAAEAAGFDSLWVMDHFLQIPMVGAPEEPMLEAYTLLGALAARTTSVHLGALVTGVTYRNPALLAKQVTALDVISAGRAILGIGAAWFDQEHAALGFRFPPLGERFDRLEEALRITRAMFTEDAPSFAGRYYQIAGAVNRPRPVQPGGPPILVGGSGERRTLRLVAERADACNIFGDASVVRHKLEVLDRHCESVGRDPAEITRTRLGTLLIGRTQAEVTRKLSVIAERRGIDPAAFAANATVGDPDEVVAQAVELFDAGLDGLIFNLADNTDVEMISLAGETLTQAFGRLAR